MKQFTSVVSLISIAIFMGFWGCSEEIETTAPLIVQEVSIDTLEVFTSFEDHNIAQPTSVEILENGHIAVVDYGQKEINILSSAGEKLAAFGREGKGPGEFIGIRDVFETGDILNVVDASQKTISRFDHDGNLAGSYIFESTSLFNEIALIEDSIYVATTGGLDSTMFAVTDLKNDSTFNFGIPKGESFESVDFQASASQLKSGEIPNLVKNMATLRSNGTHIYAYLNSYSELRKYDRSGQLLWEKPIDLPYNEEIFNNVVELAKNRPGNTIPAFNYIRGLKIIGDEVFILTSRITADDPQLLVRISGSGNITHMITLPENTGLLSDFDISASDNLIYLASSQDGFVYKTDFSL
jgi:hypothetical protein